MQRSGRRYLALGLTVGLTSAILAASQNQTPAPFRSGVVLVPLDVRVIDRDGQPVTDLTAADFTILEDGVPQQIAHFSTRPKTRVGRDPESESANPLAAAAPSHRTFVIVLGHGYLNGPVKALDALIDFVREKTLPEDRVGVIAYLRASELTTDHQAIVRFLERYRERHVQIEDALIEGTSGNGRPRSFQVQLDPKWLSQKARSGIDALFQFPGLPRFEDLPGASGMFRQAYGHGLDLIRAIDYLRHFDGEKHLIFVSQEPVGISFVSWPPHEHYWVQQATGARVALHLIHAGGVATPAQKLSRNGERLSTLYTDDTEFFRPSDLRLFADQTGGTSAYYQQADKPLAHLDRITRFQYLLGYYPTAAAPDDQHRVIQVSINRPGVTALYRHGYQARPRPGGPEDFRRAFTEDRIATAAWFLQPGRRFPLPVFTKPPIKLSAVAVSSAGDTQVRLDISFDPSRLTFVEEGGSHTASVDLAAFVDDRDDTLLGDKRERVELTFSPADYARIKRDWLQLRLTVTVTGRPAYARAVVYDTSQTACCRSGNQCTGNQAESGGDGRITILVSRRFFTVRMAAVLSAD